MEIHVYFGNRKKILKKLKVKNCRQKGDTPNPQLQQQECPLFLGLQKFLDITGSHTCMNDSSLDPSIWQILKYLSVGSWLDE